jgi:hypothetical protein
VNASRVAPIPIAHVQAEMVAFPLASEAGLELGLTSLHLGLDDDTGHLWRMAEQELAAASPAVCLDELVAMRDDLWFQNCASDRVPLWSYLEKIAHRYLTVRGSVAIPGLKSLIDNGQLGECSARNDWRWLSLALPPDLLLAGLQSEGHTPTKVDTISPVLARRWMDDGFAEPHVHLNACFDFGRIWVNTVRGLADPRTVGNAFKSPGASFGEGAEMAAWLLRAAIARYVLAAFLGAPQEWRDSSSSPFLRYLEEVRERLVAAQEGSGAALLAAIFDELYRGRRPSPLDYASLRALYHFMIDVRSGSGPDSADSIWAWDPIAPLLSGEAATGGTPEIRFVAKALSYMKGQPANQTDYAFAGLFWQVVRIRCLFYRHLVQRPMTPGLQWFVRFFKRLKPVRLGLGTTLTVETAALLCGQDRGLRSLEVRVSPDDHFSKIYSEVRDLNRALRVGNTGGRSGFSGGASTLNRPTSTQLHPERIRPADEIELGIVFHLTRDRGGHWFDGRPTARWAGSHADPAIPQGNSSGYRYGRFYRESKKAALATARLLRDCPGSLHVVRGLDLCTDEAGVPSWIMAPLLRYIREAGCLASAALHEARVGTPAAPPLRTTVHAGEDFVHLMTGLRRLDEALDHLGLAEGDRLGHALSLGVEPRSWAEEAGRVAICREERLFDLAWEWSWYSRQGDSVPGGRDALVQREIADQSAYIFGEALSPWELTGLVTDLHDEQVLRDLGFPDGPLPSFNEHEKIPGVLQPSPQRPRGVTTARRYLTNPEVFARGREIIWLYPARDVEALEHLQAGLRRKVGTMGLTVEVNPSSNLLIGRFGELGRHPLWRLAEGSVEDGVPPLSVCIGSDDPLTFATTLPEEYQLLYDA